MRKRITTCLFSLLLMIGATVDVNACTGVYVGSDVSDDGSSYIARSEDVSAHNKIFKVIPAADHAIGESYVDPEGYTLDYPSHTYRYTVIIDDPAVKGKNGKHDYPEVGFNENNVFVSATISTGYHINFFMKNGDKNVPTGIGEMSMASVALQEATSARNAMEILAREIDTKGASKCNIIFASDGKESWMMEILSGHQYAAVKLHEDEVAVFANAMSLDYVGRYDDYIISDRLIEESEKVGLAKFRDGAEKTPENLLIAKSYAGTAINLASSKYRLWGGAYLLNQSVAALMDPTAKTFDYANGTPFFKPADKVSLTDIMKIEGYRYEGTPYDANVNKTNRPIGDPTQMEIHIAQFRPNMEADLSGIQWQAFSSGEFTVYIPYFTNLITDTHASYQVEGNSFNNESYFWNFYKVMDLCATDRENYGKPVKAFWDGYQKKLIARQKEIDLIMQHTPKEKRSAVATKLGMEMADDVFKTEQAILQQLQDHIAAAPNTTLNLDTIDASLPELVYDPADYSQVDAAIQKAKKLNPDDYKNFNIVNTAIKAVVRDKNFTEQDAVDAMAKAINDALANLQKKDSSGHSGSGSTNGTDNDKGTNSNHPNTGDTTHSEIYMGILLIAGAGLCTLYYKMRKNNAS